LEAEKSAQELSALREQLKNRENDLLKLQDDLKVAQKEKDVSHIKYTLSRYK